MIFTIRTHIPTLNEYIKAERSNRYIAAKLKAETQEEIGWELLGAAPRGLVPRPLETPQDLAVVFVLSDMRKDWDNIQFGLKFIQDALVEGGWLKDDSPKYLNPPQVFFAIDKADPRTVVKLTAAEPFKPQAKALEILVAAEYEARFR